MMGRVAWWKILRLLNLHGFLSVAAVTTTLVCLFCLQGSNAASVEMSREPMLVSIRRRLAYKWVER